MDDRLKELFDKLNNEVVPHIEEVYKNLHDYEEQIPDPNEDLSEKHLSLLKAAEDAETMKLNLMNEIQQLRGEPSISLVGGRPYSKFVESHPVLEMMESDESKEESKEESKSLSM